MQAALGFAAALASRLRADHRSHHHSSEKPPDSFHAALNRAAPWGNITHANAGSFSPTSSCASPKLWLLLHGQVRTHHYTQHNLAEVARLSSGDCYFAVGVADTYICEPHSHIHGSCAAHRYSTSVAPLMWSSVAKHPDSVADILRSSQRAAFGGRLAYAIARFDGMMHAKMHKYSALLAHAIASLPWAADAAKDDAIVLRTRFDVAYPVYFDLDALRSRILQRAGAAAAGLVLGQEYNTSQSDSHMITTLSTYRNHVAFDGANCWGYGLHAVNASEPNPRPPCHALPPPREGDHGQSRVACAILLVESWRLEVDRIVRNGERGVASPPTGRWGFEHLRIYCAYSEALLTATNDRGASYGFRVVRKPYAMPVGAFLRSRTLKRPEWPAGCWHAGS